MTNKLKDQDYILEEDAAWIEVKGFAVRLFHCNDRLRISVCKSGEEYTTIFETEVFDNSLKA